MVINQNSGETETGDNLAHGESRSSGSQNVQSKISNLQNIFS